jgi:hypothetical protein
VAECLFQKTECKAALAASRQGCSATAVEANSIMHSLTRRQILQQAGAGFGSVALQSMLGAEGLLSATNPLAPKAPHFAPKAKSVIFLFMYGGPSHVDLFDPKP